MISCGTLQKSIQETEQNEESVVIKNDSQEYEIIIYDIDFSLYLKSIAKPAHFYSQDFYETKNVFYTSE